MEKILEEYTMEIKYLKLYAAFKAGYLGENILNTYFPFLRIYFMKNILKLLMNMFCKPHLKENTTLNQPFRS